MPHWLDMCYSMCTVGALGMFLGIWTDHRFGPITSVDSLVWTYGFMLVACNFAMFRMTRCHHGLHWSDPAFLSMLIGGNLGMIAGMKIGRAVVSRLVEASRPVELSCKLAGMTLGMAIGMEIGSLVMHGCFRKVTSFLAQQKQE